MRPESCKIVFVELTSVFVGREEEIQAAETLLDAVIDGGQAVYCIESGPGMGKTAVAQRVVDAARKNKFLVLNGSLTEGQELPNLWPWKRILRKSRQILDANRAKRTYGELTEEFSFLFGNIDTQWNDIHELAGLPENQRKYRLYEWIGRFLDRLCRSTPLLVLLEDLHSADDESMHLLEYLVDELEYSPVFFLLTWRPGEGRGTARLEKLKTQIPYLENGIIVRLSNLDRDDIHDYLDKLKQPSSPGLRDQVLSWTGGVPLKVALYLEHLHGEIDEKRSLPSQINQLFWQRVERTLSSNAKETLYRLAMLGNGFRKNEIIALVSDISHGEKILKELIDASLIKKEIDGSFYMFFHDEFRRTLLGLLDEEEKRRIVLETVSVLEGQIGDDRERLTHLLKGLFLAVEDLQSIKKGIEHTLMAVEFAKKQNAWSKVIEDLERMLRRYKEHFNEKDYRDMQFDLCMAYENSFKSYLSVPLLLELIEYYRGKDDWDRPAELLSKVNNVAFFGVKIDDLFSSLLERCPAEHPRRVELLLSYGDFLGKVRNERAEARKLFEEALAIAIRDENGYQEIRAIGYIAMIDISERKFQRALEAQEEILFERRESLDIGNYVEAQWIRTISLQAMGRMKECRSVLNEVLKKMFLYQNPFYWGAVRGMIQRYHLRAGEWADVQTVEWGDVAVSYFHIPKVVAWYLTGNLAEGDQYVEKLLAFEETCDSYMLPLTNIILSWLICIRVYITGEEKWLKDSQQRIRHVLEVASMNPISLIDILICAGRVVKQTFTPDESKKLYQSLRQWDGFFFEEEEYSIEAAKAFLALNWGDRETSLQHFEKAVVLCDKYEEKPWRAWYLYERAKLLMESDPKTAREHIQESRSEAVRLGMGPLVDRIDREDISNKMARPPKAFSLGITGREREVLTLLAGGLTDKEIADKLNVSPYTVGNHLRNIYKKIDKNTRGEAVHWAVSNGLVSMTPPVSSESSEKGGS